MRLLDRAIRRRFWEGEASGASVLTTTYAQRGGEGVTSMASTQRAYTANTVVFAAVLARVRLFSQVTFKYQDKTDKSLSNLPPRAQLLEEPWPNGTTGELLARMEQDVSLAGNAYIWKAGDQLVRLRPDWVTIVSELVDAPNGGQYRQVVGYWYEPPVTMTGAGKPHMIDVADMAHWSPIPDPWANFRGMSWLTPALREVDADNALVGYKIKYLENAASPNLLLKYTQKLNEQTLERIRERVQARYGGVDNAFKTLVLDQGADHAVIGNSLEQMNYTSVAAAGENRILLASGVPGIIIGSKEGLQAATYSNYQQASRSFADYFARSQWQSVCPCLQQLIPVPAGQRLWFDVADVAALRQGEQERATTIQIKAQAVAELVRFGFDPISALAAVESGDITQATHKGLPMDVTTYVPKASPAPVKLAEPGQTVVALNGSGNGGGPV